MRDSHVGRRRPGIRAVVQLLVVAALAGGAATTAAGGTKLLRFPDIHQDRIVFSYAGDLWTVGSQGGTATRLTSHPGVELFGKFSPDGRRIAFTGQYSGDEQVYVMPADGGAPRQLTFYPAVGPLAERWGYDNQVYGWTPDGSQVLFRSARDAQNVGEAKLYTVPMSGGMATAIPLPQSGAGHYSPDGQRLLYSPLWRDFRSEKRYQGGWANDLYIVDLEHPVPLQVTNDPHTDRDPMWTRDAIFFNSDRTGTFNLYRYDLDSARTTQLTHYTDWDVRWPSADLDGQIVYELDGELHVFDTHTAQDRRLDILVPTDDTTHRRIAVNAADDIESLAINPLGERLAIVARGDVFTVPVEHGVTRNLTQSSGAHDREVAWSNDGMRVAYVSDRSGEEEVYVQAASGTSPAQALTQGSHARYSAPRWSGDDKRVAYCDQTGTLYVSEINAKRRIVLARDPTELTTDYQWSPDGQFLSYALNDANGYAGLYVWSVADGKARRVTPENFQAGSPAWSPDGSLLYFLSDREYQPLISGVEEDFATNRQIGIFALTLRKDGKNPFGVRDDEPGTDDKSGGDTANSRGESRRSNKSADKALGVAPKTPLKIDFEGLMQRVIRVPIDADNISDLHAADDHLLYLVSGGTYYGREPKQKPTIMSYSIKEREAKKVIDDVTAWSATADGKHVLAQVSSKAVKYVEVGGDSDSDPDDQKSVSLAGLETTRVPAEEWHEIFGEVWRRYRDFFYVANMHGYDWAAMRRKYEPLVDSVASRADLNYVIAEMISELVVQHAYIEGGDLDLPSRPYVALPGARFELDAASGRYRIAAIFQGENEEEHYRSPLTEVGVDVRVGDYVLSINGKELRAGTDPYELLQAPEDEPVEWRVSAAPSGQAVRTILYQPLSTEADLLYLQWVEKNRAAVERLSHGRLAYIHIPDMGAAGLREFIKWWYPQVRKEGLIVDVRGNEGGNISAMLIERLATTLHGMGYSRNHEVADTYPRIVQPGPKVALINETTASDGDIFANAFREWRVGQLIGKRTWGGVVGITERGPLLDGGTVFVPEFGTADASGHWIIEGHGVEPDIVVEQDPVAVLAGHDPQLERGVVELMQHLPAVPVGLPPRPPAPVKTGAN